MKIVPNFIDGKMLRNFVSLVAIQGSNYIFPLLTFPYLARVLGPENFGRLGFSQATIQYCMLLVDFGFGLTAARAIAQKKDDPFELSKIFWSTFYCKLILCLLSAIFLLILCNLFSQFYEIHSLLAGLFLMVLASVFLPTWYFQGTENMGMMTLVNLISRTAFLPLVFFLVKTPEDIVRVAWFQGVTNLLGAIIGLLMATRSGGIKHYLPKIREIRATLADSWHVFLSLAGVSLYTSTNVVLLRFTTDLTNVALFVGAEKIRTAAVGINGVLTNTFYPRISMLAAHDASKALDLIKKIRTFQISVSLVTSVVLFIFAEPIVHLLLGNRLMSAVPVLRVLAVLPLMISISHVYGVYGLLCFGKKVLFSRVTLFGGLINIALLPFLSSRFNAAGAAFSVALAEFFIMLLMIWANKYSRDAPSGGVIGRNK